MTKSKQWIAGAAVVMLLVLAAGFLLLVQPKRSDAADLREQAAAQAATTASLEQKLQELVAQQKGLPQAQAELAKLQKQLPTSPQLPSIVRAISTTADQNGVTIVTLSPSKPLDVEAAAPQAVVPTAAPEGGTATAPQATATSALVLQRIPLNIEATGTYAALTRFLSSVESLERPFLIDKVQVNSVEGDSEIPAGTLRVTLNASVFMTGKSAAAAQSAALAPAPAAADASSSTASTQ